MKYFLRLDDACERRNIYNWNRIEKLLDKHNIKPLVGVIPYCKDSNFMEYNYDDSFWERVKKWMRKDWEIALHGFDHVCITESGGVNPVNYRSEFAAVPLELQKEKIRLGLDIFKSHDIYPKVFFAPSHTFDENTITALLECSDIRFVSDTIAYSSYNYRGITFIPQQSGKVRFLPFNIVTFCYHPNTMVESDFKLLDSFLSKYNSFFCKFELVETTRQLNVFDNLLKKLYFYRR